MNEPRRFFRRWPINGMVGFDVGTKKWDTFLLLFALTSI
jgi:hypothetical protein